MITEHDFQRARRESSFRESFIGQIELGDINKYVEGCWYIDKNVPTSHCGIKVTPIMAVLDGREISSLLSNYIICVFPSSFDYPCEKLDDFLSALIDHEAVHAKKYSINGFPKTKLSLCENEVEAYEFQIEKMKLRECFDAFSCNIYSLYNHYLKRLSKMKK